MKKFWRTTFGKPKSTSGREVGPDEVRQVPSQNVTMLTHDAMGRKLPPGTYKVTSDPDYKKITIGSYTFPSGFEEDKKVLEEQGFVITREVAGEGGFAKVLFGRYGAVAQCLQIPEGSMRITEGTPFAAKFIGFPREDQSYDAREKRQSFATEKYVLTQVDHPNVVAMRMAFNMGEPFMEEFMNNPGKKYLSYERVYIIMDFAHYGNLGKYLEDLLLQKLKLQHNYCVKFIKELFSGLKYLHDINIYHGDIHLGNVLMFNTGTEEEPIATAKWSDFGVAYVFDGRHYSNKFSQDLYENIMDLDLNGFSQIIDYLIFATDSTDAWKETFRDLVRTLKMANSLNDELVTTNFSFLTDW